MPQGVERDLADDGDGGGVEEFPDTRAHERRTHYDLGVGVHDQLGGAPPWPLPKIAEPAT